MSLRYARAVLIGAMALCGCDGRSKPAVQSAPTAPGNSAAPPATGDLNRAVPAAQATGYWNQSQVETYLKEELKLSAVTLTASGEHHYTGTDKGVDGENYTLDVKQVPGGIACEFKTSNGGGRVAFGNLVP